MEHLGLARDGRPLPGKHGGRSNKTACVCTVGRLSNALRINWLERVMWPQTALSYAAATAHSAECLGSREWLNSVCRTREHVLRHRNLCKFKFAEQIGALMVAALWDIGKSKHCIVVCTLEQSLSWCIPARASSGPRTPDSCHRTDTGCRWSRPQSHPRPHRTGADRRRSGCWNNSSRWGPGSTPATCTRRAEPAKTQINTAPKVLAYEEKIGDTTDTAFE